MEFQKRVKKRGKKVMNRMIKCDDCYDDDGCWVCIIKKEREKRRREMSKVSFLDPLGDISSEVVIEATERSIKVKQNERKKFN
jgi:hypothetical protein